VGSLSQREASGVQQAPPEPVVGVLCAGQHKEETPTEGQRVLLEPLAGKPPLNGQEVGQLRANTTDDGNVGEAYLTRRMKPVASESSRQRWTTAVASRDFVPAFTRI
jgi:hypothetical protein